MLLGSSTSLDEQIVEILSEAGSLTAKEILRIASTRYRRYSLNAVYKSLSELELQGVVVKERKLFFLKTPWVLDLQRFAEKTAENCLDRATHAASLAPGERRKSWVFTNLVRLDRFWTELSIVLLKDSQSKQLFDYVPHPWFLLIHHDTEAQFISSLERFNVKMLRIIGGRGWLDKHGAERWKGSRAIHATLGPTPFDKNRSLHFGALDDLVLEVQIPGRKAWEIDALYDKTRSLEQLDAATLNRIFYTPCRSTVRLERNRKKSLALQKTFARVFGSRT